MKMYTDNHRNFFSEDKANEFVKVLKKQHAKNISISFWRDAFNQHRCTVNWD